jgi:hypothetical protein
MNTEQMQQLQPGDLVEYRDWVLSSVDGRYRAQWVSAVVQKVKRPYPEYPQGRVLLSINAGQPEVWAYPGSLRPSPIPALRATLSARMWEMRGQVLTPQVMFDSAGYTVLWLDGQGACVSYDELGATATEAEIRAQELVSDLRFRGVHP